MKRLFALAFLFVFCLSLVACGGDDAPEKTVEVIPSKIPRLMAITDQKNDEIIVVDLNKADITASSAIVWQWSPKQKGDVDYANRSGSRLDDAKLRNCDVWGGAVVGVTSSSGLVALISYPSGDCLFNADASGYGPHSIEILPNGLIAVACSGNSNSDRGEIRIYRASSKTDPHYVSIPLKSAHGVVWDPQNECLWGLGQSELNAYEVGGVRADPSITQLSGIGVGVPPGGHDLSAVYGNPDRLWITTATTVLQYSKADNKLYYDYEFRAKIDKGSVKSINSFSDGTVVFAIADPNNKTANHNTNVVRRIDRAIDVDGSEILYYNEVVFENRDFYKVRIFDVAYQ